MKHLQGLNPQQQQAVLAIEGPVLVLAGAGSGKTRVIVERIREIIRRGVEPERILAITFTNKAAGEMRSRTRLAVGQVGQGPFVSTFHSLGLTLLKENHKLLGYKRTPAIYDRADSLRQMKHSLKAVGAEDIEPRLALAVMSRQKGEGITAGDFAAGAQGPREAEIAKAWAHYEQELYHDTAVDFDDLLVRAVELLQKYPEVRTKYHERWTYLHIDEYQDTNKIQAMLADLLLNPERNICVVGDPDQTIYSWRGAVIENILHFEKTYHPAVVILLDQNYRSTGNILRAANQLIGHNTNRPEKNLTTQNQDGALLSLYIAGDAGDEALFVARKIKELMGEGPSTELGVKRQPQDFAVLYRANFQSRAVEEKLLDAGIPYQVLGTRFFERKEVKDILSFIRAAISENPADLGRAIDTLPGIGKVTKLKILAGKEAELGGKIGERVKEMRALLRKIAAQALLLQPSVLLRMVIVESGMESRLKEDKFEGAERLENLAELVSLAARYDRVDLSPIEGLEKFLESAALASDQDELKEDKNQVRLMTVHAAKGLEFPYVFIIGLEEGLFPYVRDPSTGSGQGTDNNLEEERRLMYVALTRAQKKVFLSYAMMRTLYGATDMRTNSSFLAELPGDLLEAETPERLGKTIYLD